MVLRFAKREAGLPGDALDGQAREVRVRVDAGSGRRSPQRQLGELLRGVPEALDAARHLRGVAAELLPQPHRGGVHQVGAPRLEHAVEGLRLVREQRPQVLQRRDQLLLDGGARGDVDGGRDDVVRRLAEVDVVVGVDARVAGFVQKAVGPRRDHLVRVHVGGGAGAGLVDVEHELVVPVAARDLGGGPGDRPRDVVVHVPQVAVDPRGRFLDQAQRLDEAASETLAADGEVLEGALGLGSVQGVGGDVNLAEGIALHAVAVGHSGISMDCAGGKREIPAARVSLPACCPKIMAREGCAGTGLRASTLEPITRSRPCAS